jgi:predicted ATP-dependent endonuclease of OLD family
MRISSISIGNFRKLKKITIAFSKETTLFVGANNSGKTSAMDALRKFLVKGEGNSFIYNDITVTNRKSIKQIGEKWVVADAIKPDDLSDWIDIVPFMDVWLDVENNEFHYVASLIPTLEWTGGRLGVRLCYFPKDIGKLFDDYIIAYLQARKTEESKQNSGDLKLEPQTLCEYIESNLSKYFAVKSYILDPDKADVEQPVDFDNECENAYPFEGIIKVDMIDAQRGLADADSSNNVVSLPKQLRTYYDKHIDVNKATTPEDLDVLSAMQDADEKFNNTLGIKFKDAITELATLGYPGITDPKITIESKLTEKSAFEHDSAVQYALSDNEPDIRLPEKYNGLGYQNLISIVFRLMSFRDDRIHKGKAAGGENAENIVPLHLVLLEEPEAHLHVQVQQVLIKKAYAVLTNSDMLKNNNFNTQLVVSTHSSHIAKEVPFRDIRYFKRVPADKQTIISTSSVINLTNTFGEDEKTEKFVQRYLRVTHCDLFFADAVIFVEGTSETVFVPYFIQNEFPDLDSRYITILSIGGSHSHRFKPLIEKLGISTLVITDIDPAESTGYHKGTFPKRNTGLISGNSSITKWGLIKNELDYLLDINGTDKILVDGLVRIAYQTPITVTLNKSDVEVLSATFEDSLTYANLTEIANLPEDGIVAMIKKASEETDAKKFNEAVYHVIHDGANEKVSFALELIYQIDTVSSPPYISDGLTWLQSALKRTDESAVSEGIINE